jgi:uncharacterized membrane protein YjgN (DUF898 family)
MAISQPAASPASTQHASFYGKGGSLFGIIIVNALLTIVTLGIYSFWAKVKVRRYLYNQTEFAKDRFAYHGTGKELLIGFLKAVLVLGIFYVAFFLTARFVNPGVAIALIYIGIVALIPLALYGSMRYTMSRTSWRGIRFSFRGGLGECYREYLGGMLLTVLTLGIYLPFYQANMRRYWSNSTYFGNTPFRYDGKGSAMVGYFLLAILLTIPTLYLYWVWYAARQTRYHWSHTSFSNAEFSSTVTGGAMLWLAFSNILLLIVTLGLAFPWIFIRSIRFQLERTGLTGQIDWTKIMADARAPKVGATGESLADGLDVGVAIT